MLILCTYTDASSYETITVSDRSIKNRAICYGLYHDRFFFTVDSKQILKTKTVSLNAEIKMLHNRCDPPATRKIVEDQYATTSSSCVKRVLIRVNYSRSLLPAGRCRCLQILYHKFFLQDR